MVLGFDWYFMRNKGDVTREKLSYREASHQKGLCTHLAFCLQMNKAATATSMPIKNRPALTPSITPNKGSATMRVETTNAGGHVSAANEPGRGPLKLYLPWSIRTGHYSGAHTEVFPICSPRGRRPEDETLVITPERQVGHCPGS